MGREQWQYVYADGWEYETILAGAVSSFDTLFCPSDGSGVQAYGVKLRTRWEADRQVKR